MSRNNSLPHRLVQHYFVPGRIVLPGRDGGANCVSQQLLLPPWELRASRLRAGNLLSGRFRDFHVVPAGVVRKRVLEQHVWVERRGVRRGKLALVRTFDSLK